MADSETEKPIVITKNYTIKDFSKYEPLHKCSTFCP
jgi:hypothetical protein